MKNGFSLIEVLMVLSIIGILLAFALPSYSNHITHTRRLAAEATLMNLAGRMEGYYAEHNTYVGAAFMPVDQHYKFEINATEDEFALEAVPRFNDSRCGVLMLDSRGVQRAEGGVECWG